MLISLHNLSNHEPCEWQVRRVHSVALATNFCAHGPLRSIPHPLGTQGDAAPQVTLKGARKITITRNTRLCACLKHSHPHQQMNEQDRKCCSASDDGKCVHKRMPNTVRKLQRHRRWALSVQKAAWYCRLLSFPSARAVGVSALAVREVWEGSLAARFVHA